MQFPAPLSSGQQPATRQAGTRSARPGAAGHHLVSPPGTEGCQRRAASSAGRAHQGPASRRALHRALDAAWHGIGSAYCGPGVGPAPSARCRTDVLRGGTARRSTVSKAGSTAGGATDSRTMRWVPSTTWSTSWRAAGSTVFAVNRSRTESLPLQVTLTGLALTSVVEHSALADADPDARNTLTHPERVTPHQVSGTTLSDGTLSAVLEPLSWNVIRLA
ncbi:alpha-L-arabinofuranosidase C-terminal domain-containing protein [Streptomyces himalayensis]|uniref:alpha-L-arabinofuranosidase C-terminal domain-containing protein n=1 Tax=Streptomyces himalayensis TaxID=2820085 RepID=UPI0028AF9D44|nr:alpha-L-arabinofuranosidase C-terminal domain-containing protein [Streptomyces himalayensis]